MYLLLQPVILCSTAIWVLVCRCSSPCALRPHARWLSYEDNAINNENAIIDR